MVCRHEFGGNLRVAWWRVVHRHANGPASMHANTASACWGDPCGGSANAAVARFLLPNSLDHVACRTPAACHLCHDTARPALPAVRVGGPFPWPGIASAGVLHAARERRARLTNWASCSRLRCASSLRAPPRSSPRPPATPDAGPPELAWLRGRLNSFLISACSRGCSRRASPCGTGLYGFATKPRDRVFAHQVTIPDANRRNPGEARWSRARTVARRGARRSAGRARAAPCAESIAWSRTVGRAGPPARGFRKGGYALTNPPLAEGADVPGD